MIYNAHTLYFASTVTTEYIILIFQVSQKGYMNLLTNMNLKFRK